MWGPSEFYAPGTLRDFDVTSDLPHLALPVLIVVGRYDEVRPETASRFRDMIPGARLAILEDCGHAAPIEDPEGYAKVLEAFFSQL
jgi:pimeloyl-ACP methyl ester carboxylesterase